ncbi:hypothetical protein V8B97DRAFT_1840443, partial [Scleroderma yunnanense]
WPQNLQTTPFDHPAFAQTFLVATYGTESLGGFGFIDHKVGTASTLISEVSLYTGVTICGWV